MMLMFSSCASSKHTKKYQSQKHGLLMLEGEDIYKNKGFYKSTDFYGKQRKKNLKKQQKKNRRR